MVDARRRDGARLSAPVTRDSGTATPRCYLCEERFEPGEYTEHYNDRHLPRLVIPTGTPAGGGASIGQLLAYSADAPALMADLLVLLHHAAAQVESSAAKPRFSPTAVSAQLWSPSTIRSHCWCSPARRLPMQSLPLVPGCWKMARAADVYARMASTLIATCGNASGEIDSPRPSTVCCRYSPSVSSRKDTSTRSSARFRIQTSGMPSARIQRPLDLAVVCQRAFCHFDKQQDVTGTGQIGGVKGKSSRFRRITKVRLQLRVRRKPHRAPHLDDRASADLARELAGTSIHCRAVTRSDR